ncbi:phage tail protein [Lacticaseibacillus paracasei]|uniref:phage tail protein n=1 Tax=Lacticaseibacillus paracasei TaxID=1597 RepID=UPI002223ADA7|nr:phage tail protein [Lacticaseibacillus paracasei]MDK6822534.1 phage tail protein [Lacticaseibacillus paracasei]MDK7800041.1 phage tail protein [Lacticaseibacillus paracasei]UYX01926.1 phage tail protein [Lacticaseibacillus paracasei subsp. tolerans]UYX04909.1 phage tail protein [Lacticaseibacillus paracasei subsp. tolerans]
MKDFYFVDRSSWHLLGIATAGGGGKIHIVDDTDDQLISAGARTYSGTILFTPELSSKVQTMAARGNYILYMDERNKAVFMTIMEPSHDPLAGEETFTAEDAGIDLINETVGPYKAQQAMGIADYISLFTNDSGFEIGLNEIPNLKRTLEWTGESDTTLNRILSVATQFDNAELDFSFDVSGTTVVRRLINIHKRIGADRNITLYVDKDINKIVTSGSIYDLYTAVTPTGGTPESKDGETTDQQPITLEGYQWTDPDGRYVLTKEGVLLDPVANQTWSRLLAKGGAPSVNAAYINRVVTYTATSQATLLQSALSDLKTHNHEAVNYETDIAVLPQNINIGDTIHLADEDEHLYLSARLLELKSSYSMDTHTATLGDYLIEHDQVAAQYRQLAEQIKNIPKTIQYYPWLRYADDDQGTNMSALPAGKKYMAVVYSNKSSVPSDNPADYAGKWALIKGADGADGKDGVPGKAGADGKTPYFHIAYADSSDGKTNFSLDTPGSRKYIGSYTDFTQADSTNPALYSWQLVQGPKGDTGPQGPQGPQGVQGVPGSKDVPFPYVQLDAPANPKKGDTWWHGTSLKDATAVQRYDGSKWVDDAIAQAVLYIKELNSIILNSAEINSPNINVPFQHVSIAGSGILSSGSLTLKGASYVISGNIEDTNGNPNGQIYHTEVNPDGLLSYITQTDGTTQMHTSRISMGVLELTDLVSGLGNSAKYITSTFNAHDAVDYYHVDAGLETANAKNINITYSRHGNLVNVGFDFDMKDNNAWKKLADIRPGYKPFGKIWAQVIGNTDVRGAVAVVYAQSGGWYMFPSLGNTNNYHGTFTFTTQDDYPTDDVVIK